MDWFVFLSPLLVLAVIALLGFTGCFTKPDRPRPVLTLKATIPAGLAVPLAEFQWTEPGSAPSPPDTAPGRSVDGAGNTVLTHILDDPIAGTWMASCRVQVVDALGQGSGTAMGAFVLDAEMPDGDATFTAFGTSQSFGLWCWPATVWIRPDLQIEAVDFGAVAVSAPTPAPPSYPDYYST